MATIPDPGNERVSFRENLNYFWKNLNFLGKIIIIAIAMVASGFLGYFGGYHWFGPPGSESKEISESSNNELKSIKEDIAQIKRGVVEQLRLQKKLDADIQEIKKELADHVADIQGLKKELADHIKNEETEKAIERVLEAIKSKKCCEILSNEKR